jgi:hypothetical protein
MCKRFSIYMHKRAINAFGVLGALCAAALLSSLEPGARPQGAGGGGGGCARALAVGLAPGPQALPIPAPAPILQPGGIYVYVVHREPTPGGPGSGLRRGRKRLLRQLPL